MAFARPLNTDTTTLEDIKTEKYAKTFFPLCLYVKETLQALIFNGLQGFFFSLLLAASGSCLSFSYRFVRFDYDKYYGKL